MGSENIFGQRICQLRKTSGMTQKQVGEVVGLSMQAINDIEKGRRDTTQSKLVAFAEFFGVTIDYLVGKSDFPDYSASEDTTPFPLFPVRLKALREGKGISIFDMAEAIEENPCNFESYEKGKALPRLWTLCAMADYFDVSLDYLVGRSDISERR